MPMSRRNFVRTIVAGATVAGVPFERVYSVGRIIITQSDHGSFVQAYRAGVENAEQAREWMA